MNFYNEWSHFEPQSEANSVTDMKMTRRIVIFYMKYSRFFVRAQNDNDSNGWKIWTCILVYQWQQTSGKIICFNAITSWLLMIC